MTILGCDLTSGDDYTVLTYVVRSMARSFRATAAHIRYLDFYKSCGGHRSNRIMMFRHNSDIIFFDDDARIFYYAFNSVSDGMVDGIFKVESPIIYDDDDRSYTYCCKLDITSITLQKFVKLMDLLESVTGHLVIVNNI